MPCATIIIQAAPVKARASDARLDSLSLREKIGKYAYIDRGLALGFACCQKLSVFIGQSGNHVPDVRERSIRAVAKDNAGAAGGAFFCATLDVSLSHIHRDRRGLRGGQDFYQLPSSGQRTRRASHLR